MCNVCKKFISKSNFRRHLNTHVTKEKRFVTCVDRDGVYLVDAQVRGGANPVHVKVRMHGEQMLHCELKDCNAVIGPAARGRQAYFCKHVMSALNVPNKVNALKMPKYDDMPLSKQRKESVLALMRQAAVSGKDLVVQYDDVSQGKYFSVFAGKVHQWSCFGRVLVSLKNGILRCPCSGNHFCVHKCIVKCVIGDGVQVPEEFEDVRNSHEEMCTLEEAVFDENEEIIESEMLEFDSAIEFCKLVPNITECKKCVRELRIGKITESGKIVDQAFVKKGNMLFTNLSIEILFTLRSSIFIFC